MIWVARIIFAALLISLLGFVGLFVASNGATGISTIVHDIEIDALPSEVIKWLIEPDRLIQWVSSLVEVIPVSNGEVRIGSIFREFFVGSDGNSFSIDVEVIDFAENEFLSERISSQDLFEGQRRFFLREQDGKTLLTYFSEIRFTNLISKLSTPIFTPSAQAEIELDLEQLKYLIEI